MAKSKESILITKALVKLSNAVITLSLQSQNYSHDLNVECNEAIDAINELLDRTTRYTMRSQDKEE